MRLTTTIACAVLLAAAVARGFAPAAEGSDDLPFDAYVVSAEADVYSGPADPHYATMTVARGTKVEVYEQQDQWLGIRPPEGSYSWVPSSAMTMSAEPGVAEATDDGVACWIGSSAERVREHQSAVQLKRGEPVEVLGKKEVQAEDGQRELWLKIAPPAGEFRWIHASQVSRTAPSAFNEVRRQMPASADGDENMTSSAWTAVARERLPAAASASTDLESSYEPTEAPLKPQPPRRSSIVLRDIAPPVPLQTPFQPGAGDVQLVAHQTEGAANSGPKSPDGFVPRKAHRDQLRPPATRGVRTPPQSSAAGPIAGAIPPHRTQPLAPSSTIPPIDSPANAATSGSPGVSSGQVQQRLAEIDVELSLMISRDRSQWNLGALKREVQRLVENGATPVDRGEARFMLDKIDRFAEAFGIEEDAAGELDLPVGSIAARKAALDAATAPKYDGSGYLTPVRAARPVAPYALLDQNGNRICYVTPVPGFNLREYENRKVGVFGKRGFMPDANASHLLAQRVVDLDKQVR